ncbi:hypothetical protein [Streptomyces tsukubensis]|uniref:hypothetical protein n=1 Tax=Streptomyces tsukubensis TaxID=83656 RepID=UPI001300BF0B|nr:hypothetical protein [Streptomyces tsukubensis]
MNARSGSRQVGVVVAVVKRLGSALAAGVRALAAGVRALAAGARGVFGPGDRASARAAGPGSTPSAVPGARLGRTSSRPAAGNGTRARHARLVRQPEGVRIGRMNTLRGAH